MKIYTGPISMYGAKVAIAAAEKGLAVEFEQVPFDLWAPRRYGHHDEVARINPKRQVPVLVDGALEIFDSTVILEYFEDLAPDRPLWPDAVQDRARARLLELKADEVWFPKVLRLNELRTASDPTEADACRAVIDAFYVELDATLDGRDYLVGSFSYADIAAYMVELFAAVLGRPMPDDFVALNAWRKRLEARPAVAKVTDAVLGYLASQNVPVSRYAA